MAHLVQFKVLFSSLAAALAIATAPAQSTQPTPSGPLADPANRSNVENASKQKAPAPARPRAISPEVAAQLSANIPKYSPPPPKPAPKPEEELPDMREIDKPKNTIIRLPKYVVQEQKPAVLDERAVHTSTGLADLAVRRYISEADRALNRFTLPLFGRSYQERALQMYAEEERLRNMSDLNDAAAMVSARDKEAGAYVKREAERTYLRSSDFGWSRNGP
jgi:hypothetical protein